MAPTVDAVRNEIRVAVGRHERQLSAEFTKEALAAICDSLDADVETDVLPGKDVMRAAIAAEVCGVASDRDPSRGFRKSELEAIASVLAAE